MGDRDSFRYVLARDLQVTLAEVDSWPHSELVGWRAFYAVEKAVRKHHEKAQRARR